MSAPSSAALSARRKLLSASRKRHPPRIPRPTPPTGPAAAFAAALASVVREMDDALREALRGAGIGIAVTSRGDGGDGVDGVDGRQEERAARADAQGEPPAVVIPKEVAAAARRSMRKAAAGLATSGKLARAIDHALRSTDAHSRAIWAAQADAIGLEVTGDDLILAARAKAFRAATVAKIKSLAAEHVARVGKILTASQGARVEAIQAEIQAATGASKARAALIARDQVLQLNAQVTADRHKAAGITEYTWSASRDQRVREEHREMDGKVFEYANPPIADKRSGRRGNPGEVWQCRCVAIPVMPE